MHTGEPVEKHDWVPPQSWTAWPLRADLVPNDDFMKRTEDEDDTLTYRRYESNMPSTNLEESISATVLKIAKQKFLNRDLREKLTTSESLTDDAPMVKSDFVSSNDGSEYEEDMSEDGSDKQSDVGNTKSSKRSKKFERSFSPIVSTNDDLSYEIIRPSARMILEKLDKTLTILHNARVAALRYDAETSASEDDDDATPPRGRLRSSSRGAKRGSVSIPPEYEHNTESEGRRRNKKGAGRPRKKNPQPREGETHREFLVRIAREQHKRIPTFSDEECDTAATSTNSRKKESVRKSKKSRSRSRNRRQSLTPSRRNDDSFKMEHTSQWKLRDWSDVIGAASLAGFSPAVLARATERCVDLFGEGLVLHTLNETEAGAESGVISTRFEPGVAAPSSPSQSDDLSDDLKRARAMSRQSSMAPSVSSSSDSDDELKIEERDDVVAKRERARSRSVTPSVARFYCTHTVCKRAIQGFSRRNNLVRHMNLVHGEVLGDQVEGDESPDELYGAVHVDGFLKPIKPRPGWRSEDVRKRSRSRKRSRDAHEELEITSDD